MKNLQTILDLLFVILEDVLKVNINSSSFASFEIICSELIQINLDFSSLNISKETFIKYSRNRSNIKKKIRNCFSRSILFEFGNKEYSFKDLNKYFKDLVKNNKNNFLKIIKNENIRNHVFQYHSLVSNDVWFYDFTTLEMSQTNPEAELLIILDLTSRKIVAWKLFESNLNVTSNAIMQVFEKAIKQFGIPNCIHSDSDIKNHSKEIIDWCEKNNILPSITKDIYGEKLPMFGNQVIERFNRSIKKYFYSIDNTKEFLNFDLQELTLFISKTIEFYNNKAHSALGIKKNISPNESYFDHAIFDALKDSWIFFKQSKTSNIQIYKPINIEDHEEVANFVSTDPEFVKYVEKADPSDPKSSEDLFNHFLKIISPHVYKSSNAFIKNYFEEMNLPRVKGPGRKSIPSKKFENLKETKSSFSNAVKTLLSTFAYIMSKIVKIQSDIIVADNKRNTKIIVKKIEDQANIQTTELKKELKVIEEQNILLRQKIEYLEDIQNKVQEKELQLAAMREKRKNRKKQKLRSPVNLSEFSYALNYLKNKGNKQNLSNRFNSARDRIALFILYFSGLRISNLLLFSLQDIETLFLFDSKNNPLTSIPLIKKRNKTENQDLLISKAVVNKFVFGEFNLIEDFQFIKDIICKAFQKQNTVNSREIDLNKLPFYSSFKKPLDKISRVSLNININSILNNVKKNHPGSKAKILTSHSFRIHMITQLIINYGYGTAQKFVHHSDIKTTALYDRSIVDKKKLRNISGILAETRTGKKHLIQNDKNFETSVEEANSLINE